MRAIGYFTFDGPREGNAVLKEQQEAFSRFCEIHGHQPVISFEEQTPGGDGSCQYLRLLDYLGQSHKGFLVVVAGPQHLGDTPESSVRRILELDALGSQVLCFSKEMPDPLQQALKYWGMGMGLRGERIRDAMMARAIRGEGLGKPPFGYRIGPESKLEVVPEETATVQLIFDLYTQKDMGMRRIVRHLNELGVPTRSGSGWSIVTIRDVLRNRSYLGTYTRFGMRIPRSHQAIIDPEVFNQAHQKMAQRKTPRVPHPGEPFLLSGLSFCSSCGNRMIGVSRRQGWRRKDGSRSVGSYRYYQCQSRTNQGMCSYHTRRAEVLEQWVLGQVKEALEQGRARLPGSGVAPERRAEAGRRLKRLERQFHKALEATAAGIISVQRLRPILEEMDEQRSVLEGNIVPQGPGAEALARGDVPLLLEDWDSLDRDTLGYLVRSLVSHVSVGDDSVQVVLKEQE